MINVTTYTQCNNLDLDNDFNADGHIGETFYFEVRFQIGIVFINNESLPRLIHFIERF